MKKYIGFILVGTEVTPALSVLSDTIESAGSSIIIYANEIFSQLINLDIIYDRIVFQLYFQSNHRGTCYMRKTYFYIQHWDFLTYFVSLINIRLVFGENPP